VLSPRITPLLVAFMEAEPDVRVRFLSDERLYRLEYGEAHLAIRAGAKPDQPDNIVQRFFDMEMALFATEGYVARHGPLEIGAWDGHRFVSIQSDGSRAPFYRWLGQTVPESAVRYRASRDRTVQDAVLAGAGIGFLPADQGRAAPGLVEMAPPRPDWTVPVWLVTHVDLHRTAKVQRLLAHLKEGAAAWRA
jgi:DNA-binding transcriptional LysR family regulator